MARKTEKCGKFINVHCRTWNMVRKLKIMENEKHPLDNLKHTKSQKSVKMRNAHSSTWNMVSKLKIRENNKYTL